MPQKLLISHDLKKEELPSHKILKNDAEDYEVPEIIISEVCPEENEEKSQVEKSY